MVDAVRVVLVDDAADLRSLVRTRLRLTGRFEVVAEGATGGDALVLCERHEPDLLLLDVSMPDMDGLEALVGVRERTPGTAVVLFSGFEEQGLAERALSLGAADFVEKSVYIEELVDRLLAAVGRKPAAMEPVGDAEATTVFGRHLERFRTAFDEAAIGMATLTLTGRVVRANATFELLVPSPEQPLIGAPYPSLVAPLAREELSDAVVAVASGKTEIRSIEHQLAHSPARVVATIAAVADQGEVPLYLLLQVQDVTARRQAEEELRRSEERFRLLVETVADYAIFMLDPQGNIASWNVGAERTKGYTAEEIIGRHFSVFYTEADRERRHPEHELEVAVAEGRFEEEGWRVRKDGSHFWANVLITALRTEDGQLLGFSKVTRDVTERKRLLDERERVAAERSQFLAITAHELRTPVAVVNGYAHTLRDHWAELDEDERRAMTDALARGGERLSRLVEDLLIASRLESGALDVRVSRMELAGVLREVLAELAGTVEGAAEVTMEAPSVRVLADRGRVQQMLGNYLTNALRYGRPPVRVLLTVEAGDAVVRVCDAGDPIDDDLAARLFGKFARGQDREGTGLGLFIVRELARAQGGDAWMELLPDGNCFAFRLPLGS